MGKRSLEYLKQLEKEKELLELKKQLPHLYTTLYSWQREFIDSTNKMNLCTAANQVGKSVWMIIKAITHATDTSLWPKLWPEMIAQGKKPAQFWYMYEDKSMIMREFITKWIPEWLPRGKARHEGPYRWTYVKKDKTIEYIHFLETDVRLYFFSYGQGVDSLQASTVYEIFVDEELPFEYYDELSSRLTVPRGIFNAGFTATKGQEEWRLAMEEIDKPEEKFPKAFKKQISAHDCLKKEDGSQGLWDEEMIELRTAQCSTHNAVLQRIYGKFVKAEGLVVSEFDIKRHFVKGHGLNPKSWSIWCGIDAGSGGEYGHPAGIVLLAVNNEATKARVLKCWRGDGVTTTNTDILKQYQEISKGYDIVGCVYDKASKDLYLTAASLSIPLIPADKRREEGFGILNSLFKHDMLKIYHSGEQDDTSKLKNELMSYSHNQNKNKVTTPDNLIDPLRYIVMQIMWNFDEVIHYNLIGLVPKKKEFATEREKVVHMQSEGKLREYEKNQQNNGDATSLVNELNEWSDYFDDF